MRIPRSIVADLCRKHGPEIPAPAGIDGVRLMWAIAGNESTFGDNCAPRHEPAYDVGGLYSRSDEQAKLLEMFGSAAACSYGPWQVMACNAVPFTPGELESDPDKCAEAFVRFVTDFIIGFREAKTLEQIAQTYNSGNFYPNPEPGVLRYAEQARHYYDCYPLPDTPVNEDDSTSAPSGGASE